MRNALKNTRVQLNYCKSNWMLSGNQLKIIAVILMTIDHIGAYLLSEYGVLRIIGRLAFPIFAYMISEGCRYTKDRKMYLMSMLVMVVALQTFYFLAVRSLYQSVFTSFSLSIMLIYTLDKVMAGRNLKSFALFLFLLAGVFFLTDVLPKILSGTGFYIDYGFFGVLLPVFVYIGRTKIQKLILVTIGLLLLSASIGGLQWYSVFAIFLLALYNGKRGGSNMKNFFYIYYPMHLAVIYLISCII